jgi:hypothetical protein
MVHSRNHDERLMKLIEERHAFYIKSRPRTAGDGELESALLASRRGRIAPAEERVTDGGADQAPTELARRRERERHRIERTLGRIAAGEVDELRHEVRSPTATRERLAAAARVADILVAGHPIRSQRRPIELIARGVVAPL